MSDWKFVQEETTIIEKPDGRYTRITKSYGGDHGQLKIEEVLKVGGAWLTVEQLWYKHRDQIAKSFEVPMETLEGVMHRRPRGYHNPSQAVDVQQSWAWKTDEDIEDSRSLNDYVAREMERTLFETKDFGFPTTPVKSIYEAGPVSPLEQTTQAMEAVDAALRKDRMAWRQYRQGSGSFNQQGPSETLPVTGSSSLDIPPELSAGSNTLSIYNSTSKRPRSWLAKRLKGRKY
jgi:hypothetical protein